MMIFFDIDDTLLDSEAAHRVALTKIISDYALKADPQKVFDPWIKITDHYLNLLFRNLISLREQRAQRIKELFLICGKKISEEEAIPVYSNYHRHFVASCKVFPETIPVLKKLQGLRMGIISNGPTADQTKKLVDNGLIGYFNPVIISEAVGHSKPQREIFNAALTAAGELPGDCIFIGDSYENDYIGGINAGIRTIWLDRKKTLASAGCETIHCLSDLVSLLAVR